MIDINFLKCLVFRMSKLGFLFSICATSLTQALASPRDLLDASNDPTLIAAMFLQPNRLLTGSIADSGAEGANVDWEKDGTGEGYANPEYQRFGADLVAAGLTTHDDAVVQKGLKVIAWGFAQQQPNGGFDDRVGFHSTSMFVEAGARTLLLLEATGDPKYAGYISKYTPVLHGIASWLTLPDVVATGQRRNKQYTHRRYLLAAALIESGTVTHDQTLTDAGIPYLIDGLSLQTPEGINPEKGGFDVTYQAFGILLAERCYWQLTDENLRLKLKQMIVNGLAYESTKVSSTGEVSIIGSTRTGVDPEHYTPKKKGTDYRTIVQAYIYAADITGDDSYRQTARLISVAHGWIPS